MISHDVYLPVTRVIVGCPGKITYIKQGNKDYIRILLFMIAGSYMSRVIYCH